MCGLSKEQQLQKNKEKKQSTFGKKPTKWNNIGIKKTKVKKYDVIDEDYLKWLGTQPCVVTGILAKRGVGANEMHIHHINGRNPVRNDYETVPLIGMLHTWGSNAYHQNTKADFIKKNKLLVDDIKEYFKEIAESYKKEYKSLDKFSKTC
jgi:hypothetical protein